MQAATKLTRRGRFDRPFDKLMVVSAVEPLKALNSNRSGRRAGCCLRSLAYLDEFATFRSHQYREDLWHERQQILEAIAFGVEHDNRDF